MEAIFGRAPGPVTTICIALGETAGVRRDSDQVGRVSLGFARIEGAPSTDDPNSFKGENVWGAAPEYAEHQATFGGKVATMISIDGTLYAFGALWTGRSTADAVHRSEAGPVKTLIWSKDLAASWQMAPWQTEQGGSFLNFGRDNLGAPDAFVYIYYQRRGEGTRVYLKRVPKGSLTDDPAVSSAYEYLTGVDLRGNARAWSHRERDAAPVFVDPRGVDLNVAYDAPLGRFLVTAGHNPAEFPAGLPLARSGCSRVRIPGGRGGRSAITTIGASSVPNLTATIGPGASDGLDECRWTHVVGHLFRPGSVRFVQRGEGDADPAQTLVRRAAR